MTSAQEAAARCGEAVLLYGRAWIVAPSTKEAANALGLDGIFGYWVNGRAGVLGDATTAAASSAIAFASPEFVARHWEARPQGLSAAACASGYADVAADFARRSFADWRDVDVAMAVGLVDTVLAGALDSMGALFAGWRAMPRPTDDRGALGVMLQTMREMRGGAHIHAVHAAGLDPLRAIVSTDDPVRGGEAGARRFGWTGPFPAPDPAARREAERLTDAICASAFEPLSSGERADLATLLDRAQAATA